MEGIQDKKLLAIGRAIGNNEKLLPLALELNFTYAEFENFKATNHSGGGVTSAGTISMLFTWREKTRRDNQAKALFHALEQAELVEVAEEHLPEGENSPAPLPSGGSNAATNQAQPPVRRPRGTRINERVAQEQLDKISREFPNANFESFSLKLGTGANQANNILAKHCKDYRGALMEILMAWKNRTCGPCSELEDALRASGGEDLIESILYK